MRFEAPVLDAVRTLHERLRARGERLTVAESCTGGLVAAAVTAVDGSSDVFDAGLVTYADRAKVELLDVPDRTIEHTGAVSGPTARAMAVGARDRLAGVDWGLSVTGLAGPGGGRPGKPVGTVYIGVAWRDDGGGHAVARRFRFDGGRSSIRQQTTRAAIELVVDAVGHSAPASKRPS